MCVHAQGLAAQGQPWLLQHGEAALVLPSLKQ